MRAKKGSSFERSICKRLSKWWTKDKRDDVFWRCSQSGGRATQRMKSGRTTFGSYGDIAAVDPIGQPLLELFTIELKRGSSHGIPGDLLDFKEANSKHAWVKCLMQTIRSHDHAGSKAWALIGRRDHRQAMIYLETRVLKVLRLGKPLSGVGAMARFSLFVPAQVVFTAMLLEDFLANVHPSDVKRVLANWELIGNTAPVPSGCPA